jgi:hypothetical protein
MTLTAYIDGIGIVGPGLADWPAARAILAGQAPYASAPTALPAPQQLPPSERRRASRSVKLVLAIGEQAIAAAGREASTLGAVFTSSAGDGQNCHEICQALASGNAVDRQISPTRFHNSVHNAPAGYWSIASGAMASSSVICAYDASFGAGLLEALAQVATAREPAVLIAYDCDYPEPLRRTRPVPDALGIALVLAPERDERSLARIDVTTTGEHSGRLDDAGLERLRLDIPAARGLTLLRAIAAQRAGQTGRVVVDYLDDLRLAIEVRT